MLKIENITVSEHQQQQRLDNFLMSRIKAVPKARIYRAIRKGEVRVNKKRADASYKLQMGDQVRFPLLSAPSEKKALVPTEKLKASLLARILYEDENLLIINKPSGMPVHGGTHQSGGVIDYLRLIIDSPYLELAHRLDKDTSGCLLLAKKGSTLKELHHLLREGELTKQYLALVLGQWPQHKTKIDLPLLKNQTAAGERMVKVNFSGQKATTLIKPLKYLTASTLIEATLVTGRTHQIRVHCAANGHPIAGDTKYGDKAFNRLMQKKGLQRMFLHAKFLSFKLSGMLHKISVTAPLDDDLHSLVF